MDSLTLLFTLALTFAFGIFCARQLLGGMLYLMARSAVTLREQAPPTPATAGQG